MAKEAAARGPLRGDSVMTIVGTFAEMFIDRHSQPFQSGRRCLVRDVAGRVGRVGKEDGCAKKQYSRGEMHRDVLCGLLERFSDRISGLMTSL